MTNEEKYLELLKALAELIAEKNDALYMAEITINNLKHKLDLAEGQKDE